MNILIIKLSAIGDVIHTLPALNAIRKHYPDAHITWVVEAAAYPLIEGHAALDRVLVSKRKQWVKKLFGKFSSVEKRAALKEAYLFIKALRDTRYDLVIDFQQLLKSGAWVGISKGGRKAGFNKGMEHQEHSYLFLNERIPPVKMDIHALLRNMMLLDALGIPSDEIVFNIPVRNQDHRRVSDLLARYDVKASDSPLVAINPVAKWETKLWSDQKFSSLADRLIEQHRVRLVFTGGPEDRETVRNILSGMKRNAANLAGETSLKELAALYEKTAILITTDTGPMHLAAAVGTPVVAIFGPTAPWRTGPFGTGHQVIRAGTECSPCFKRQCPTKECMNRIHVEDVLSGVRRLL